MKYFNFPDILPSVIYEVRCYALQGNDNWVFVDQVPDDDGVRFFKKKKEANVVMCKAYDEARNRGSKGLRFNVVEHKTGCTHYLYIH